MIVGIDFDGTISLDPLAFKGVVEAFLNQGHDCAVVTWRVPDMEYHDFEEVFNMWGFRIPVVCTSGQAKRDFYPADIWIEDNPAAILFGLSREPRFVEDAKDYDEDVMVCSNESGSITTNWKLLNPRYNKLNKA